MKISNINTKSKMRQAGQGMTEYIIIVALIAIAAIGVSQLFGQSVQGQMAAMASELGGGDGNAAQATAQQAGATATNEAATLNNLDNYTDSANIAGGAGG